MRNSQIDSKRNIQTQNIRLELLRQRLSSRVVFTKLARVYRHHRVNTTHTKTHDDSSSKHDSHSRHATRDHAKTGDEHEQVSQGGNGETGEQGGTTTDLVSGVGGDHGADGTA